MLSEKPKEPISKRQQLHHIFHIRRCFSGKKNNAANSITIFASINKCFDKCTHQLTKVLSVLARKVTPSCRIKGFEVIEKKDKPQFDYVDVKARNLLPPLGPDKKGTIVLDLDETLVHSRLGPPPPRYDFAVSRVMDGVTIYFYVFKRPGVDEFLEIISKKYEVVVFTAGHKAYASKVIDTLDPKGLISHRFYRDSCKQVRGKFIKDLSEIGRDLRKTVIVDDNPKSYSLQPENGIPIKPFYGDELWDRELMKLAGFFERCDVFQDMRDAVNHYLRGAKD
ncbi:uncharacterized protein LOC105775972 [Gossypium raimondii]|uniref:uncharacterized protein LOC105775972 n=1 Tax=Gossypium raimondii TaxID=29730 RepID=UPI00227AFB0D|nr:uncharacterized protein LOC105775972 [Gossypium raimondii]